MRHKAETSDPSALARSRREFVRRWGEMASYWGINRTMAEIHALLFASIRPLCTDDIMAELQISRGNASMNLRRLVDWGLARRTHQRGDRKEYFVSQSSVWEMFETILLERRRREVEPIIETIRNCRDTAAAELPRLQGSAREEARAYLSRLQAMLDFLDTMNRLFNLVLKAGEKGMGRLGKLLIKTLG